MQIAVLQLQTKNKNEKNSSSNQFKFCLCIVVTFSVSEYSIYLLGVRDTNFNGRNTRNERNIRKSMFLNSLPSITLFAILFFFILNLIFFPHKKYIIIIKNKQHKLGVNINKAKLWKKIETKKIIKIQTQSIRLWNPIYSKHF